ncbi:hypothetical protein [Yinghuangia sp. YIM S10712]|uniref:hypothetical protein n=1 Tax=Yinghuangia sp. YIM S10712 TaxID=3436930 RepID=UPI003F53BB66
MGIWDVKGNDERMRWTSQPLVGVGPLKFGMLPHEVREALGGQPISTQKQLGSQLLTIEDEFADIGVRAYYTSSTRLACVAVDARRGPQVSLAEVPLVARVPSEIEQWIVDYTRENELDLRYTHAADPASTDLGLILRAQRAGDVVISRPLFMVGSWAVDPWDTVPPREWETF